MQTVNSMELETSSLGFLHTANKMALDPNMGDVRKAMKVHIWGIWQGVKSISVGII